MTTMVSVADDGREQQEAPPTKEVPYGGTAGADEHSRQPRGDLRRQQIIEEQSAFATKGYRGTGVTAPANVSG